MMKTNQTTLEKRILIVDDDQNIGEGLQLVLTEETQYRALWIAEIDLVLLSAPHLRPSLILLDYRMPLMDGLQLYDHFQESETIRGIPVVLISAVPSLPYQELEQRGIPIMKKPLEMTKLLSVIEALIAKGT